MEQQEKNAIRSQRLRRAVTCLKRKEKGGSEEDGEEERSPPVRGKVVKKEAGVKDGEVEGPVAAGGGFLGSAPTVEPPPVSVMDVSSVRQEVPLVNSVSRRKPPGSSSSSSDDSDVGGDTAVMVRAKSVFDKSARGRGVRGKRGRGGQRRKT